jgi:predicted dehydrogenase
MAKDTAVRLGIIGCGIAAAELHWPALATLRDDFEIVSLCNRTPEKAVRLSKTIAQTYDHEIPIVLDYHEMLADPAIDAVAVIVPIELNQEICTAAAAAGKHILVEKPIAHDEKHAQMLLKLESKYPHLVMMVAENFRYRRVFAALGEMLGNGIIGAPYFLEWRMWEYINAQTNIFAQTPWRIDHRYEGGFVTDGGIHNVAALRDVFGDLDFIASTTAAVNPAIGRTDSMVWLFRTTGRPGIPPMPGVFNIGFSVLGAKDNRLTVLGSQGTAVVENSTIKIYRDSLEEPQLVRDYPDTGGYVEEYRDFHRAIVTGARPKSTFAEAAADLATILGALQNASS